MSEIFKKSYNVKLPKSQHEVEEFGGGKKGLVICQDCNSTYFKKSWHHNLENVVFSEEKNVPIKFTLCPACQMIANKQYEGRITIKNVTPQFEKKLEELIGGFSGRARERDPLDRLIELKKSGSIWIATFTENQLVNKLAKKIQDAFSGVKKKVRFSREPSDVAEITIELS